MFIKRKFFVRDAADDGTGGGASGGDDVQAKIDAAVNEAVNGLKNKNTELLGKLKQTTESLKVWDGFDPENVKSILDKFTENDEAELIKAGKIEDVIKKRTEKRDAEWQKKLDTADLTVQEANGKVAKFMDGMLSDKVRAAVTGKVHDGAVDDALLQAKLIFNLDDDGQAVQLDGENIVLGKDGKTPFSIGEWIESMREVKPHWFPANQSGTGARQSSNGKMIDTTNMSPREKMAAGRRG